MINKEEHQLFENNCILCGKCLEVCPLFQATYKEQLSPRGKAFLLQESARREEEFTPKAVRKLSAICLGCQKCVKVCPQGLNLPAVLREIKAENQGWRSWLWGRLIEEAPKIFPLLSQCGKIVPEIIPAARGNKFSFFSRQQAIKPWLKVKAFDTCGQGQKTVIFPGCTARYAKRQWLQTAAGLIKNSGYELLQMPDWACCGFTLGLAGLKSEQWQMQMQNLQLWRTLGRPKLAVFCATCQLGLQEMTASELGWEAGEREIWRNSVRELGTMLGKPDMTVIKENAPAKVTLHQPCHADDALRGWMESLLNCSEVKYNLSTACCGLGGSMQIENPGLSSQVAQSLWDQEKAFATQQLITACSGCALQLAATHPPDVRVNHWLELISHSQQDDLSLQQQRPGKNIEEKAC